MAIKYKKHKRLNIKTNQEYVSDKSIMRSEDDFTTVVYIPFDDLNVDYKAYKAWLDEGNTPEAAA